MQRQEPQASVHSRVRNEYADMPPAERRLADLVLNFPGELAGYSASELARMAETSSAAVTRFVRRLGFVNYEAMRRWSRKEREEGSPVYLMDKGFGSTSEAGIAASADSYIDNVRATFSTLEPSVLKQLAVAIAKARRVSVLGFRHGFYLAGYLCWSLAHARPEVRLLPRGGETLGESLVDLGPEDVVLVFAFRRRVPALGRAIDLAREVGARVAVFCDAGMVDTHGANWVLLCQSKGRGPIDDHGAALAVAHRLTELVLTCDPAGARKRMADIDTIHERLAELG